MLLKIYFIFNYVHLYVCVCTHVLVPSEARGAAHTGAGVTAVVSLQEGYCELMLRPSAGAVLFLIPSHLPSPSDKYCLIFSLLNPKSGTL